MGLSAAALKNVWQKGLCFLDNFTYLNLATAYEVHLLKFSDFYREKILDLSKTERLAHEFTVQEKKMGNNFTKMCGKQI